MAYVFSYGKLLNTALIGKEINNKDFGVTFLGAEAKSIGCDMNVTWRIELFFSSDFTAFFFARRHAGGKKGHACFLGGICTSAECPTLYVYMIAVGI